MLDRPRPRRSPARYLAPLVLVAVAVAIYLVVQHASTGGAARARTHTVHRSARHASRSRSSAGTSTTSSSSTASGYYTVKPGDTLSGISARTGVPLPQLQSLNPKVASGALQVGQRLRLR